MKAEQPHIWPCLSLQLNLTTGITHAISGLLPKLQILYDYLRTVPAAEIKSTIVVYPLYQPLLYLKYREYTAPN